ncbi:MAG: hypothetical protein JWO14_1660 [Solirubrobacterales bacterium]|nr:hypothetical protein [Solirubrobacterales bacterium]
MPLDLLPVRQIVAGRQSNPSAPGLGIVLGAFRRRPDLEPAAEIAVNGEREHILCDIDEVGVGALDEM